MDTTVAAKLVAVTSAMLMAGYGINASQATLPIILDKPASISTPIFTRVYRLGLALAAPSVILSSSACAYLAYVLSAQRSIWAAASALAFTVGPFTGLAMLPGIHRLIDISESSSTEQVKAEESGEVRRLLKAWTLQNWVRAALNFGSGGLALWASIQNDL